MPPANGSRAVISGMGVVSPFGVGRERFWQEISQGRSGTRLITAFDTDGLPSRVAASVPPVTIEDALPIAAAVEGLEPCYAGRRGRVRLTRRSPALRRAHR